MNTFGRLSHDWIGLVLRLTVGGILFPHGAQKVFGWFGGPGFAGEMDHLTTDVHLPVFVALAVIIVELVGSLCLILGLASRFWAAACVGLMIGIIFVAHLPYGFFMNWFGTQPGEGIEYHLLMIGTAVALFIHGGGGLTIQSLVKPFSRPYSGHNLS